MTNFYHPPSPELWTGRAAVNDHEYWYQVVEMLDLRKEELPSADIAFIGYRCEEGVRLNQGRVGAMDGPNAIRYFLPKLTVHHEGITLADAGDLVYSENLALEQFQKIFAQQIARLLKGRVTPIALGGGHDISYAHFCGIHQALNGQGKRFGIINFDAHFDLRKEDHSTSGTPFHQILTDFDNVSYLALGIQRSANTKELFDVAHSTNTSYMELEVCSLSNIEKSTEAIKELIEEVDHLYVTIDMDGFSSAHSPGVSAPSPFGLTPEYVKSALSTIISSGKIVALDLAETNPIYDVDNATARLAAKLVWEVVQIISST